MKILLISDNFPPEVNAPATRGFEHCIRWVKNGAAVQVITCAPNFPGGKVYPPYRNRAWQQEMRDGVEVIRVWSYIAPNKGGFRRIVDYLSFSLTSVLAGVFSDADVIVATSPQFFTAVSGFLLSRLKRKPWVFEVRDLWPDSIVAVGAMRPSLTIRLLERLELFLYRDATRIVVVTQAFKDNLVRRGIAEGKIAVVTNGADVGYLSPRPKDASLLAEHELDEKFVIGYVGTHGMAHGLDFVLEAAAAIDDPRIHFLFLGDGAMRSELIARAKALNLTNVSFLPAVQKTDIARYWSLVDAALVNLRRRETFLNVLPSKIFEAAAMGKPMLLGVDGEARRIVEHYDAGLYFEPENKVEFIAACRGMASDATLRVRLQQGCDRLARAHDRNELALQMFGVLKEATAVPRAARAAYSSASVK